MSRDWMASLWPASYRGVPFWVERDGEAGGRRLVVHEFPKRDDPFVEDMGEKRRDFEITGYLAGDAADAEASALVAVCTTQGTGVLVLPEQGPVTVQCNDASRAHERDRMGHVAVTMKFVRDRSGPSAMPQDYLAQLAYDAAAAVGAAAASLIQQVRL